MKGDITRPTDAQVRAITATTGKLLLDEVQMDQINDLVFDKSKFLRLCNHVSTDIPAGSAVNLLEANDAASYPRAAGPYDGGADSVDLTEEQFTYALIDFWSKLKVLYAQRRQNVAWPTTNEGDYIQGDKPPTPFDEFVWKIIVKLAAKNDEMLALFGDSSGAQATITGYTARQKWMLKANDGIYKILTDDGTYVVDAAGAKVSIALLDAMIKTMHDDHLGDEGQVFFMHPKEKHVLAQEAGARETDKGDLWLHGDGTLSFRGFEIKPITYWPRKLESGGNRTFVLFGNPVDAINYYTGKDVVVRYNEDEDTGDLRIWLRRSNDTSIFNKRALVLAKKVALTGSAYTEGS